MELLLWLLPLPIIGYLIDWLVISRAKKRKEEERRFESGEMTKEERENYIQKKIKSAEEMYHHGNLSLLEFEAIKKKYGKSNLLDNGGLAFTAAASNKIQAERAISAHQKKAERDLIFQSTAGGAINGTAGAVIGAVASASKSAKEGAVLESQRAAAEQAYHNALDDIANS